MHDEDKEMGTKSRGEDSEVEMKTRMRRKLEILLNDDDAAERPKLCCFPCCWSLAY